MAGRLALELPKAPTPTEAGVAPVSVSIGLDSAGQAFWDGQPVDANTLTQRLQEAAQRDPSTEVQLRADTAVPYGRVAQLIGLAQTSGLSRIGFVVEGPIATPAR